MLFSERDMAALRLFHWCQYIQETDAERVISETDLNNLIALKLIKRHKTSGALMLSTAGKNFLLTIYPQDVQDTSQSYHSHIIQRRLRLSKLVMTAYQSYVNVFEIDVQSVPALVLPSGI